MTKPIAVIVGVGSGLSASLARLLAARGYDLVLAARDAGKLATLAAETGAKAVALDATREQDVDALFDGLPRVPDVVVYNASGRVRGPFVELDRSAVRTALDVTAFGAFLVAQTAARLMLPQKRGTILLTGATAGVKGFAKSAPFAMGKFALRGLAQSMARELHPLGIHVAHVVIDGSIRSVERIDSGSDSHLDPDAIALSYLHLIDQPRNSWSSEIEVRPWLETF